MSRKWRKPTAFPRRSSPACARWACSACRSRRAYGGLGVTMEEEVSIAFELGRTSPAFRSLLGTNNGIGSQGIVIDGTEEQKRRYLPRLASGELLSSFCLTEPDSVPTPPR
ncbi:acyl-CoA dehydrogenase family protein [Pseudomonas aeruginosa]|nr:acyl-CoA dehydrogenase family protein [Pseudomonas aeruginosa]